MVHGLEQRPFCGRRVELEATQQGRHVAEPARPSAQLGEEAVVRRLRELADTLHRLREMIAPHQREHGGADVRVRSRLVQGPAPGQ